MKTLLVIFLFINCFALSAQHVDEKVPEIEKSQNTLVKAKKADKKSLNTKKRSKSTKLSAKEEQDLQISHKKRLKKNKELKEKSLSKKREKENIKVYDKKDPDSL